MDLGSQAVTPYLMAWMYVGTNQLSLIHDFA
jgi:hypothetical protein